MGILDWRSSTLRCTTGWDFGGTRWRAEVTTISCPTPRIFTFTVLHSGDIFLWKPYCRRAWLIQSMCLFAGAMLEFLWSTNCNPLSLSLFVYLCAEIFTRFLHVFQWNVPFGGLHVSPSAPADEVFFTIVGPSESSLWPMGGQPGWGGFFEICPSDTCGINEGNDHENGTNFWW